ncbi:MAG TPA: (Fe-S)-binding protein [Polyangiaceae bacterium]|nr:(Fe-S)-binding protein [Polyangiaceae bacterium]
MKALQELARKLLEDKTVSVVIGYEEGPHGVRPAFITKPDQADRLIFDPRCVHNLATFLSPRRSHLVTLGKKAVVVKGCDARAIAGLVRETQIKRDDVVVIGVRCGGVTGDPMGDGKLTEKNVAPRCAVCDVREPKLADHLVGELPPAPPTPKGPDMVAKLDAMTPEERWAFWQKELERCVRCHACREVCPMCFCERCIADKSMPQWIESSAHPRANLSWQMTRVLHMAGRCVGCGECVRACPANIPLGLILKKVAAVVEERYGYRVSDDPSVPAPIGTYRLDDKQEFIL